MMSKAAVLVLAPLVLVAVGQQDKSLRSSGGSLSAAAAPGIAPEQNQSSAQRPEDTPRLAQREKPIDSDDQAGTRYQPPPPPMAPSPSREPLQVAQASPPVRPQIEVTKVEGTEGVYIFRNGNHQSMFVVTKDGVIATDPIAYGRPSGGQQYVDEIRRVTDKPIKYLIYSHHHFDHIAGGKAFKDAGARVIAHKNATARLKALKDPNTVIPDESVGDKKVIKLGGTTLELSYLGLNHSDSTLVMRLPKEKIVFIVDTIPVGTFPGRGFIDIYPLETEDFIKKVIAMDWDRMIPGHPGQPGDRLGTKDDAKAVLTLMQEASAAIKTDAQAGKCWDAVEKDFKMEKYATLPGYANGLPMVARRYCGLWGRGT